MVYWAIPTVSIMRRPSLSQNTTVIGCYVYAAAGFLAVVLHPGLFSLLTTSPLDTPESVLPWVFVACCLGGALGIVWRKWWGFAGLYTATFIGTFGLALSMVPFVINAFAVESRTILILMLNSVFLVGLIVLHLSVSSASKGTRRIV